MARVLGVMAASMRSRSMLRVSLRTSTNTGLAPTVSTTLAVATQVNGVVMTSSPLPTPATRRAISSAAVAEFMARTGRPPTCSESAASNARARGPVVIHPERRTSATSAIVASSMEGRVNGRKLMRNIDQALRATRTTPMMMTRMPSSRCGPTASPNSHQARPALTT